MTANRLSVIIPVLHDEVALRQTLPQVFRMVRAEHVIVVDGGSTDGTVAFAESTGARVLKATVAGRGSQMNLGATLAQGDVLLFLHADTRLPDGTPSTVLEAIDSGCVGGAFSRRFDSESRFLRFTCRIADWRGRRYGWFYGDQAIFVRRDFFECSGGFREWQSFEDLDFSRRMARAGRVCLLHPPVISSARRFARRGPLRQTLVDVGLTLRYLMRGTASLRQPM